MVNPVDDHIPLFYPWPSVVNSCFSLRANQMNIKSKLSGYCTGNGYIPLNEFSLFRQPMDRSI